MVTDSSDTGVTFVCVTSKVSQPDESHHTIIIMMTTRRGAATGELGGLMYVGLRWHGCLVCGCSPSASCASCGPRPQRVAVRELRLPKWWNHTLSVTAENHNHMPY